MGHEYTNVGRNSCIRVRYSWMVQFSILLIILNSVISDNRFHCCYNTDMEPETVQRLLALNRQFYQTFALQFSVTRRRLQPGVQKILARLLPLERILDLGCGNGELARALQRQTFKGEYIGLDFSAGLLAEARRDQPEGSLFVFKQADLSDLGWSAGLPEGSFAAILALAVLHHIPGQELRRQVLRQAQRLLESGGLLVLSNWQFLNSPRLVARIQPWERLGLEETQVEEGDFLLDWRQGGSGLRYIHHFSEAELERLAEETSFTIQESFWSDGENGRLSLYQVWRPAGLILSSS